MGDAREPETWETLGNQGYGRRMGARDMGDAREPGTWETFGSQGHGRAFLVGVFIRKGPVVMYASQSSM